MSKETITIQHLNPPGIIQRDTRRSDELRQRVAQLGKAVVDSEFDLGEALAEIQDNDYWANYGFESHDDYLKNAGLDYSPRTCRYMVTSFRVRTALGISREAVAKAGTSKCKEIFRLDPAAVVTDESTGLEESMADIIKDLVQQAPFKTVTEIKEMVDELKGKLGEDPDDQLTWLNLPIQRGNKELVIKALDAARLIAGETIDINTKEGKALSDATALYYMAADFLAGDHAPQEFAVGNFQDSIESGPEEV